MSYSIARCVIALSTATVDALRMKRMVWTIAFFEYSYIRLDITRNKQRKIARMQNTIQEIHSTVLQLA